MRSYSQQPKLEPVMTTIIAVRPSARLAFSISVEMIRARKAPPDSVFVLKIEQVRLGAPDLVYRCVKDDSTEVFKRRRSPSPEFYLSSFSDI